MKKILFILFFPSFLFSQQKKIDSLEKLLSAAKKDTNKVNILNTLCWEYYNNGSEKSLEYGKEALKLAEQLNYKRGMARSNVRIGIVQWAKGQYPEALDSYFKAIKIYEAMGDSAKIPGILSNVGNIYAAINKTDEALQYFKKALDMDEKLKDKKSIAVSLANISNIYNMKEKLDDALLYSLKALQIKRELNDKRGLSITLNDIGVIYEKKFQYKKAQDYYFEGLKVSQDINEEPSIVLSYYNLGISSRKLDKMEDAINYLKKSFETATKIDDRQGVMEAAYELSETYAKENNYKNAYEYHQKYVQTKDTLLNEESSRQITEMQTKYETEKKEQQITLLNKDKELQDAQLNRQKIVIWSVAGGFLIVLMLSIFIFRERKKSEKLLLNILPAETAKELKAKGKASPKYYESVTIMFTDFKGFTTIAEKLSAEELVSELDFLFKKFDAIISKYNIEKIKTIGDAYMCASGLPTSNSNHAEEIVKAGLEIQNWMIEQNNKWQLRIGIHSGAVTAGVVGDKKFAYDIWGDTVNVASRMESSGEAGKINISGATYQILQGFQNLEGLEFKFRGKIPAKNKGEIEMYFVAG
ncbi:MAG: tetratricopeptide repeat protein [Bacteroidetes bacterium]|nr:tetratricopeptide repeat protein [Bacteroidota bacterium]